MHAGVVKTYLSCPDLWGGPTVLELPPTIEEDAVIELAFTIPSYGEIEGLFRVTTQLPCYHSDEGFYQEVTVTPVEGHGST